MVANSTHESALGELLSGIITQFGGAIEFWTLVCISQRELGDPVAFIDRQSNSMREQIQELRARLSLGEPEPSDAVMEQAAKLARVSAELREVFDYFIQNHVISQKDLEAAVMRLAQIWQDVRMRVWLLGALIPLASPPALTLEQEAYYQSILDNLFDQFIGSRASASGDGHDRNGKFTGR